MSKIISHEFGRESIEKMNHKTPCFVFSKKKIEDKFREFQDNFPGADIHFAMKANAEKEILSQLLELGSGFEVASVYELEMLKEINVPPEKIIYGTSVKPVAHIKDFADYGVSVFSVDSLSEIEKISLAAPGAKVYVRVVVNDTGSVFKFSEKFGTEKENAIQLLSHAKELGLVPYGISFHVGSQASNLNAWANALNDVSHILEDLDTVGIRIEVLNIGGGFPCAYRAEDQELSLKEIAEVTLKEYEKLPYKPKIILEPGRGMIAESAVAIATVIGKVERRQNTWLFLDLGVYNGLFETMAYQGSTRYPVSLLRKSFDAGERFFSLAGPTGDSPDIINREALLPNDVDVGDKLIFHDVGAYSLVATCPFNGFPKPPVFYIDDVSGETYN